MVNGDAAINIMHAMTGIFFWKFCIISTYFQFNNELVSTTCIKCDKIDSKNVKLETILVWLFV